MESGLPRPTSSPRSGYQEEGREGLETGDQEEDWCCGELAGIFRFNIKVNNQLPKYLTCWNDYFNCYWLAFAKISLTCDPLMKPDPWPYITLSEDELSCSLCGALVSCFLHSIKHVANIVQVSLVASNSSDLSGRGRGTSGGICVVCCWDVGSRSFGFGLWGLSLLRCLLRMLV